MDQYFAIKDAFARGRWAQASAMLGLPVVANGQPHGGPPGSNAIIVTFQVPPPPGGPFANVKQLIDDAEYQKAVQQNGGPLTIDGITYT